MAPRRTSSRLFSETEEEVIAQSYKGGATLKQLAAEFGCCAATVNNLLGRQGIPRRRRGEGGSNHPSWKGGTTITNGYRMQWLSPSDPFASMIRAGGYVPQHRLVMARALGRPLRDNETVHHINRNKLDNRIENLQLRIGNHGQGAAYCCADCGSSNLKPVEI